MSALKARKLLGSDVQVGVERSGGEGGESSEGVRDLRPVLGERRAEVRDDAGRVEGDGLEGAIVVSDARDSANIECSLTREFSHQSGGAKVAP